MCIRALFLFISLLMASFVVSAQEKQASNLSAAKEAAKTVCATCHGVDGNSAITLNPRLAGQHPGYLAKQLNDFKAGKRSNAVMAGMVANLTDEDIQGLADYFAAQIPKLGKAKINGKGSLGERIYRGGIASSQLPACAACHGANGEGLPKRFPRLSGQHAEYTVQQLNAFRKGARANGPMMQVIAAKMMEAEMRAVADYIQGLR